MSQIQIHGADYPIKGIFSNAFAFTVPVYQRPYAWTTEEAEELLDDLLGFLPADDAALDNSAPYFLGSIVLIKAEERPDSEVIDGQQRLTTLTILFSALRTTIDGPIADNLTGYLFEVGNPIEGTADRPRLKLRNLDLAFFEQYVQRDGNLAALRLLDDGQLSSSQRNLKANAVRFIDRLSVMPQDRLIRLTKYIATKCYLVAVSTSDLESAYRIFTVLNDRGLELLHSDILKAEIIGNTPDGVRSQYAEKWEAVEEEVGREAFAELFAHIRMIYVKAKLRESVLKEFREHVVPTASAAALFDGVIVPYAHAFDQIRTASYVSAGRADTVNERFRWLNRIDNFDWIPPALRIVAAHGGDPDFLAQFLDDLERLAAGMMILRTSITQRIERYGRVLRSIDDGDDLFGPASPLQLDDGEKRDVLRKLDGNVYEVVRVRQYVLLRLDAALAAGAAIYDYPLITVEHVLPQNPANGSTWLRDFPDPEIRATLTHRIGNLVLLTQRKNSQAQNYDFDQKKTAYFQRGGVSDFPLTTQVINEPVWTAEVIERRQGELLRTLARVWRLD